MQPGFELRRLEAHELEAYAACQGAAFSSRYPADRVEALVKELDFDRTWVVADGGELVATASSLVLGLTLPGLRRVPVAGVTDVAVAPTHRRRGLMRALMRRQLDEARERGEPLAALFSSEGAIYQRFGYGPATYAARYCIDKRLARLHDPETLAGAAGAPPGSVRLLEATQAYEALPAVFAAQVATRVGEMDRPEGEWSELLGQPAAAGEGFRFFACYEERGRIDGYAVYHVAAPDPVDRWHRAVFLEEMCSLSDRAYVALWRYLLGIDLTDELRTKGRPVDEAVRHLLCDGRQLRTTSWRDRSWVRLVEVQAALALRSYGEEGTLVLELADPFCPWNEGRYLLSVGGDGRAVVERTNVAPDLVLPIEVLGSAYLGAANLVSLASVGRVGEQTAGAAKRADRMFAERTAPFCTTHF